MILPDLENILQLHVGVSESKTLILPFYVVLISWEVVIQYRGVRFKTSLEVIPLFKNVQHLVRELCFKGSGRSGYCSFTRLGERC